jgi:uncharacterized damage-inducible protein DinB
LEQRIMISSDYVRTMARYNRWQNRSLYEAADKLSDVDRRLERGAFWGSIHGTLNHLLWGDRIWLARFMGTAKPMVDIKDSGKMIESWAELKGERSAFDETMIIWADALEDTQLAGNLTYYSGAAGRELTRPKWLLITHMFNHGAHHRGQAHGMLTRAGAKPDDTDLPLLLLRDASVAA